MELKLREYMSPDGFQNFVSMFEESELFRKVDRDKFPEISDSIFYSTALEELYITSDAEKFGSSEEWISSMREKGPHLAEEVDEILKEIIVGVLEEDN